MTAIITICAIIAVIAVAEFGSQQGQCLMVTDRETEDYGLACTYTFAAVAIAVMLIVVLAIL